MKLTSAASPPAALPAGTSRKEHPQQGKESQHKHRKVAERQQGRESKDPKSPQIRWKTSGTGRPAKSSPQQWAAWRWINHRGRPTTQSNRAVKMVQCLYPLPAGPRLYPWNQTLKLPPSNTSKQHAVSITTKNTAFLPSELSLLTSSKTPRKEKAGAQKIQATITVLSVSLWLSENIKCTRSVEDDFKSSFPKHFVF